jgi:hypothetical protein
LRFLRITYIINVMKMRKGIDELWEELKYWDGKWNDDNVFESINVEEFLDDVNEMYEIRFGRGGWVEVEGVGPLGANDEVFERACNSPDLAL